MTALLDAVAAQVAAAVPTLTAGSNLFAARMPEAPDRCVAVSEYEGQAADYTLGSGVTLDRPRIQVLCRAGRDAYPTAHDDAATIHAALDVTGASWSGVTILRCVPVTTPAGIGVDASERPLVAVRFDLTVAR